MRRRRVVSLAFVVVAVACAALAGPRALRELRRRRAWAELRAHVGKDLLRLDKRARARVESAIAELVPRDARDEGRALQSCEGWGLHALGDRFVLLDARAATSPEALRIDVLDAAGSVLSTRWGKLGPSSPVTTFTVLPGRDELGPLLVVQVHPYSGNVAYEPRHLYALFRDELVFVRLDASGRAVANECDWPDGPLGLSAPSRSEEEWAAALASPERAELLRTLVHLSGVLDERARWDHPEVTAEAVQQARLMRRGRDPPAVRARLAELSSSNDPWVAEQARLLRN
jgi:hypothetical protein